MRKYTVYLGAIALIMCGSSAYAQSTTFRGFRIEAKAGVDRLQAHGNHDDRFVYGGAAGWDGIIGDKTSSGPRPAIWIRRVKAARPASWEGKSARDRDAKSAPRSGRGIWQRRLC